MSKFKVFKRQQSRILDVDTHTGHFNKFHSYDFILSMASFRFFSKGTSSQISVWIRPLLPLLNLLKLLLFFSVTFSQTALCISKTPLGGSGDSLVLMLVLLSISSSAELQPFCDPNVGILGQTRPPDTIFSWGREILKTTISRHTFIG